MEFNGKTVLITGGTSGIEKIMGRKVMERGAVELIVCDSNKKGIETIKREFSELKGKLIGYEYEVDVSKRNEIREMAARCLNKVSKIDVLINNGGIVVGKYFYEHSHADIANSMCINADAFRHITLAFLP